KLGEGLNPQCDRSPSPVLQVLFARAQPGPRSRLAGLEATRLDLERGTAKVDLGLFLAEGPEGLTASFEYAADLFDASTVHRMLGHFEAVLEEVVAGPDRAVGELVLLSGGERARRAAWDALGRD